QDDTQRAMLFFWRAQALESIDQNAALADWQQLLTLPEGSAPAVWFEIARQHLGVFQTPTPPTDAIAATPTP
ncbi:MAG: hypothetical protein WA109_04845, partial [Bellilinea sp.]